MKTQKIDFEQIVYIMNLACKTKIRDCIHTFEWSHLPVNMRLHDSELGIDANVDVSGNNDRQLVNINGIVSFAANEVPGIIVPFSCYVQAEVILNHDTGRHEYHVFFGPKEMRGGKNNDISYNVEWLYYLFYKNDSSLDIGEFVSSDFDFRRLCKMFNLENTDVNEHWVPLYEDD